jgi:hypothetical protein
MSTFSIHEAAAAEIRRIFHRSGCLDPVAEISESADAGGTFDDVVSKLRAGKLDTQELRTVAKKRYSEVASALEFSVVIDATERVDSRPEYLHDIGGITFAMHVQVLEMLHDYCLVFEGNRFLFRGPDDQIYSTLSAIVKAHKGR